MDNTLNLYWFISFSLAILFLTGSLLFYILAKKFNAVLFNSHSKRSTIFSYVFVLGLITVTLLIAWIVLDYNKHVSMQSIADTIKTVRDTTSESLKIWVNTRKTFLSRVGQEPELISITQTLLKQPRAKKELLTSAALTKARDYFSQSSTLFSNIGFFIIAPDLISIASMRDGNIGTINLIARQRPKLLKQVFQGNSVFIPPIYSDVPLNGSTTKSPTMFIAAPIMNKNHKVLAALAVRIDVRGEFSKKLWTGRIGESGETYAIDKRGFLISESRYLDQLRRIGLVSSDQNALLAIDSRDPLGNILEGYRPNIARKSLPFTKMAASNIRGESAVDTSGYRNYRGVPVFGAWAWDHALGIGLATEIDVSEGLHNYYVLRTTVLGALGLSLLLSISAVLFTYFTGRRANNILKQSHDELEKRVDERTTLIKRARQIEHGRSKVLERLTEGADLNNILTLLAKSLEETWPRRMHILILLLKNQNLHFCAAPSLDENFYMQFDKLDLNTAIEPCLAATQGIAKYICNINDHHPWQKFNNINQDEKINCCWSFPIHSANGFIVGVLSCFSTLDRNPSREEIDSIQSSVNLARITIEHKQSEAAIRKNAKHLNTILESCPAGVLVTQPTGRIIFANDGATLLTQFSQEDIVTMNVYDLYPDEGNVGSLQSQLRKGARLNEVELRLKRADGSKGWALVTLIPITYDGEKAIITWFYDLTQRKTFEEQLAASKEQAESANAAKSNFLSRMSHELRTPLNAILGFGQLLEWDLENSIEPHQSEAIQHIVQGGQHLLELINEVLDLAKIESGKLDIDLKDVEIQSLVLDCIDMINSMANEHKIVLINNIDEGVVRADSTRLKQVILNLLSNGIKYNKQGGLLTLSCREETNNMLRLTFSDTGKGIPANKQLELYQPFSRLGAENTDIEGTGIGLTISKRLIEAMGGRIGFSSIENKGTSFWIELCKANSASISKQQSRNASISRIPDKLTGKILYIEDNKANVKLMQKILNRYSTVELLLAPDGESGLNSAIKNLPDLILMDINLPGMNGIATFMQLKQQEETCNIPVIAVSAAATALDIQRGLEIGFKTYLTKPFNVAEVLNTIEELLQSEKISE